MKTGIMNHPMEPVLDEAAFCGRSGFDFLDLTIEGPNATTVDVPRLRSILDSYGMCIVGHTDPCLPHAYPVPEIRKACLSELERCAAIFSALGASLMNIHPCYFCPPAMKKDLIALNIESLRPVVEMAGAYGLAVAVENYQAPFDRVSTFDQMLKAVPGLRLHLDFGHANFGKDNHLIFCRQLGEYIGHVHFSDNRSRTDDHMPLGVGTVDWKNAVDSLKEIRYDGTITLEVFCNTTMRRSYLDMSRKMILDLWESGS